MNRMFKRIKTELKKVQPESVDSLTELINAARKRECLRGMSRDLTEAEKKVLILKSEGYDYNSISQELGISTSTVNHELRMCRIKLHARDTAHLMKRAFEEGILK